MTGIRPAPGQSVLWTSENGFHAVWRWDDEPDILYLADLGMRDVLIMSVDQLRAIVAAFDALPPVGGSTSIYRHLIGGTDE